MKIRYATTIEHMMAFHRHRTVAFGGRHVLAFASPSSKLITDCAAGADSTADR